MPTKLPPAPPQSLDLSVYQGTTVVLECEVAGAGSIAAATIAMKVKERESDADEDAVIVKRVGDGVVITQPGDADTPGKFEVTVSPTDTSGLTPGTYLYDVKVVLGGSVFAAVERSHFAVLPAITVDATV